MLVLLMYSVEPLGGSVEFTRESHEDSDASCEGKQEVKLNMPYSCKFRLQNPKNVETLRICGI